MEDVKKMFLKYADDEFKASLELVQGPLQENENTLVVEQPAKFKYVDGVYRLSNMPLPWGRYVGGLLSFPFLVFSMFSLLG